MRSCSHWNYRFPGSKLRSRISMTSWMLPSCLYLFVVRMWRSRRDSLTLAMIFMFLLALSQRSIDIWFGSGGGGHGFTGPWGVALQVPVREDEVLSLQVLGASSLALWM